MRELYYNLDLDLNPIVNVELSKNQRHTKLEKDNINPDLFLRLKEINLLPADPYIFYSRPGFKTPICHIDGYAGDFTEGWPSLAKLNYVVGESNTLNMWYDVPTEKRSLAIDSLTSVKQPYQFYWLKDCQLIKTSTANPGWCLFEAGVPHTVANQTDNPKWTISFIMCDLITRRWITYQECKERLLKLTP